MLVRDQRKQLLFFTCPFYTLQGSHLQDHVILLDRSTLVFQNIKIGPPQKTVAECFSLAKAWLDLHFHVEKTDQVGLSIQIPERKQLIEQLSNFSVETLHCSLAEEVQADSRTQRAGEK